MNIRNYVVPTYVVTVQVEVETVDAHMQVHEYNHFSWTGSCQYSMA